MEMTLGHRQIRLPFDAVHVKYTMEPTLSTFLTNN